MNLDIFINYGILYSYDENVKKTENGTYKAGEKVRIEAVELLAQALCHEIDHLNGITFVDVMEEGTLQYVEPEK